LQYANSASVVQNGRSDGANSGMICSRVYSLNVHQADIECLLLMPSGSPRRASNCGKSLMLNGMQ
jgi:hypothetical protein